jgi:hypothetical protein
VCSRAAAEVQQHHADDDQGDPYESGEPEVLREPQQTCQSDHGSAGS